MTVDSKITNVYMSAKSLGFREDKIKKTKIFSFSMTRKVPSYLLAMVAGNIVE